MHPLLLTLTLTLISAGTPPQKPSRSGPKPRRAPSATRTPTFPCYTVSAGRQQGQRRDRRHLPRRRLRRTCHSYEGMDVGSWMAKRGVAGFVLKYRVAPYKHPIPLPGRPARLRTVRARPRNGALIRRVVLGFSAGGHLASTAATHFDDGKADAADPIDKMSCRPDFAVLCYPVITLKPPFAHMGSPQPSGQGRGRNWSKVYAMTAGDGQDRRHFCSTPPTITPCRWRTAFNTGRRLSGLGSGRIARLRTRTARRRPGAKRTGAVELAGPIGDVDENARMDEEKLRPK